MVYSTSNHLYSYYLFSLNFKANFSASWLVHELTSPRVDQSATWLTASSFVGDLSSCYIIYAVVLLRSKQTHCDTVAPCTHLATEVWLRAKMALLYLELFCNVRPADSSEVTSPVVSALVQFFTNVCISLPPQQISQCCGYRFCSLFLLLSANTAGLSLFLECLETWKCQGIRLRSGYVGERPKIGKRLGNLCSQGDSIVAAQQHNLPVLYSYCNSLFVRDVYRVNLD